MVDTTQAQANERAAIEAAFAAQVAVLFRVLCDSFGARGDQGAINRYREGLRIARAARMAALESIGAP